MNCLRPLTLQRNVASQMRKFLTSPVIGGRGRFFSSAPIAKSFGFSRLTLPSAIGIVTAASLAVALPSLSSKHVIRNDTILDVRQRNLSLPEEVGQPGKRGRSSISKKVNYRQLCLGSVIGVVAGVVVGKISSILVFITAFGLLSMQWLSNRGLIDKSSTWGLSKYVVKTGRESIDLNTLVWDKPSFKVPFILTFVLAAINV